MSKRRRVVLQPRTAACLGRGIQQLVDAIAPTLGPTPRMVANKTQFDGAVELLDSGGTIARRVIQLPDADEDMGAMLLRQMLVELQEDVGDGTATAAVIFQQVYREGQRAIAAGRNAQRLRHFLNIGARRVLDHLATLTSPVHDADTLSKLACSVGHDPTLGTLLGEVVHMMGEYGRIEVREGQGRESYWEAVAGTYWDDAGLFSAEMLTDKLNRRTEFEDPAILISDLDIQEPKELAPPLLAAIKAGIRRLVIVAHTISPETLGYLVTHCTPDKIEVAAVKTPGGTLHQVDALRDLALLTGGRPILQATRESLLNLSEKDFGRAGHFWARMDAFGIAGGKGNSRQIDEQIVTLHRAYQNAEDRARRQYLRERIGKLTGNSATVWVGGASEREVKRKHDDALRIIHLLRAAMKDGALPGGGMALWMCREVLTECGGDEDERAAHRILQNALEAPLRQIITNAGYDPGLMMAQMQNTGCGFDALSGQVTDIDVLDVAAVQKAALRRAVESAALALTIDVLVHRAKPPTNLNP